MCEPHTFDTHLFINLLTYSGFSVEQAEALAKALVTLLDNDLATKSDILAIQTEIDKVKAEVEKIRLEFDAKISSSEATLRKQMIGGLSAALMSLVQLESKPPPPKKSYSCPIPGCTKLFIETRGGWDSHVASFKMHPKWKPDITDGDERKKLFREEFP